EWSKKSKEKRTKAELAKGYKVCNGCNINKKITDYYQRGNGGFYGECKDCHNNKVKIYVENNREVVLTRKRKYHLKNRERQLSYFRKYNLKNSSRNVERAKRWREENSGR